MPSAPSAPLKRQAGRCQKQACVVRWTAAEERAEKAETTLRELRETIEGQAAGLVRGADARAIAAEYDAAASGRAEVRANASRKCERTKRIALHARMANLLEGLQYATEENKRVIKENNHLTESLEAAQAAIEDGIRKADMRSRRTDMTEAAHEAEIAAAAKGAAREATREAKLVATKHMQEVQAKAKAAFEAAARVARLAREEAVSDAAIASEKLDTAEYAAPRIAPC